MKLGSISNKNKYKALFSVEGPGAESLFIDFKTCKNSLVEQVGESTFSILGNIWSNDKSNSVTNCFCKCNGSRYILEREV